jgi:gamma-glutamylcyclotransferase (GGCT)/AIG2-like uncharacterized protein YtfP
MPLLFSYGTLQQDSVQMSTFGRLLKAQSDELPGFEQSWVIDGSNQYANVTFNGKNDSSVRGAVFEITEAELAAADRYEQLASYKRISVMLASGKQAWVYIDARTAPGV